MQTNRNERMREALRETAAEFLAREAGRESLITVTRAELSEDGKHGTIYITVMPFSGQALAGQADNAEAAAVAFANRNRGEFGNFFKTRVKGVLLPRIEFVIDRGEKNRQRLDELSN